ncbi:MAG TPA: sulfatase-like hydrolase/transferase [Ramlibacter sp.]
MRLPRSRSLARWGAYQLAFSTIGLASWIPRTFGEVTMEQALWHLLYADGAAIMLSEIFYVEFALQVLLVPLMFAVPAALLHGRLALRLAGWRRVGLRAAPGVAGLAATGALALQFSAFSYAAAYLEPDRFAQKFVEPRQVGLLAEHRRNLILIYAESLETGYQDAALFGRDLLAATRRLQGHSYGWYRPAAGATWTIAGMVATQCGVPLRVYAQRDVRAGAEGRAFLPGATCLGDILAAHGYRNVFLGGAPLSFAGKGRFLQDHGYGETWGREEWARAGMRRNGFNAWGTFDSALFEQAKLRLAQLHASGQPFNMTLLTLDTHNPFGFLSEECRKRGATGFDGIVSCSAEQITEFVEFARDRGYLDNTVVVVIGDHLAVPNPLYDKLMQAPRRGMFNLFVGERLPQPNTDEILPFDLFPTLVELAGIRVPGDRLGLGYSAVGDKDVERPANRAEEWSLAAVRGSPQYDRLWRPDAAALGAD